MNQLEEYRIELKKRQGLTLFFIIGGMLLATVGNNFLRSQMPDAPIVNIITVAAIIFELICLAYLSSNMDKMRNEEKLKKAYIAEHDEREAAIRAKSGRPVVTVLAMALVGASLIVGGFSIPAFIALQLAAAFQLLTAFALTGYWSHKL